MKINKTLPPDNILLINITNMEHIDGENRNQTDSILDVYAIYFPMARKQNCNFLM